ncbi:nucleotidyltransferase domain-containing protein [Candidatus Thiodictyon syntrophicum]|jgi:predicted nucleotidyltransferase|uniref:DNA polymerase subunit beta n=1 Tax=Candidatus Thiodictyon syntrophicum TaxID=1166950 RepID=A0A2K8UE78_9GAMM|nr:nucleotidyltransferase domain-containing protein [Candidatus Thiodictyon syntrophicum]AUB83904.1 DNA polymerase subunit beta [Candidatus Thiodictyon syntrophicum]
MLDAQIIQSAVDRLIGVAHSPLKVILFGSYARGDAKDTSDLDLLVVEEDVPNFAEEYGRLRGAIGSVGTGVDLLIYPLNEFERRKNWQTSPVSDAVRGGKVLYERAA